MQRVIAQAAMEMRFFSSLFKKKKQTLHWYENVIMCPLHTHTLIHLCSIVCTYFPFRARGLRIWTFNLSRSAPLPKSYKLPDRMRFT